MELKSRFAFFAALCAWLLLTCAMTTSCGSNDERKDAEKMNLKVLTFNLWHGLNPVGTTHFEEYEPENLRQARLNQFLAQAKAADPDVIFLQEVNPVHKLSKHIADTLGMDYHYQVGNCGLKIGALGMPSNLYSGLTILAGKNLRLEGLGGVKLSGPFGRCGRWLSFQLAEFRYAVLGKIIVNDAPVYLMGIHVHHGLEVTESFKEEIDKVVELGESSREKADEMIRIGGLASARRQSEFAKALEYAAKMDATGGAMILAGDFNASPDSPELTALRDGQGFISATGGDGDFQKGFYTWDPKRNPNTLFAADFKPANAYEAFIKEHFKQKVVHERRRLDYIYYRGLPGAEVESAGIFGDQPDSEGRMASDHFGVQAVIQLK